MSSENEIRSKISALEDEITKVEETASKNESAVENEVDAGFNSKIKEIEVKLSAEQSSLDEATSKANEWVGKKKELSTSVSNLQKELKTITKERGIALKTKIKDIATEKKTKIKPINAEMKQWQGELKRLQKSMEE